MRHPTRPPHAITPVRLGMYFRLWYLLATLRDQFRLCRCTHTRKAHNRRGSTWCKACPCWAWRRKLFRTWRRDGR